MGFYFLMIKAFHVNTTYRIVSWHNVQNFLCYVVSEWQLFPHEFQFLSKDNSMNSKNKSSCSP